MWEIHKFGSVRGIKQSGKVVKMSTRQSKLLTVGLIIGAIYAGYGISGFCQQEAPVPPEEKIISEAGAVGENVSWVWGEVKNVDYSSSNFTILYMDYQTDDEKELTLAVNQDTKFEGISDFNSLKAGDTAGIDYLTDIDKNIAKNISVEKLEEPSEVSSPEASSSIQPDEIAAIEAQPEPEAR